MVVEYGLELGGMRLIKDWLWAPCHQELERQVCLEQCKHNLVKNMIK